MIAMAVRTTGRTTRTVQSSALRLLGAVALGVLAMAPLSLAYGDDSLRSGDGAWQRGISAEQRSAADREFQAGNALFVRSEYAGAATHYRRALRSWDHPSIQFNLAVCLIYLDRPVEAYDAIEAALRFGRDALDHFDEANNYLKLLRDRIATLEVEFPAGATVTLDGAPLGAGPRVVRRLAPGRHSLVARKPRFETWSKDLVLVPGETSKQVIAMRLPRTRSVRRWARALPWWVIGIGGTAAALGAATLLVGNADVRAVTSEVTTACPPPQGCPSGLPRDLAADRDRAVLTQRAGGSVIALGAATVATGVVLLFLNQPRQVLDQSGLALRVTDTDVALGWTHAF
jgi:tetratricopeptide (TPR) repeat protein